MTDVPAPTAVALLKDVWRNLPVPEGQLAGIGVGYLLRHWWPAPLPGRGAVHKVAGWSLLAAGAAVGWWLIHLGVGVLGGSAWIPATLPFVVLLGHPVVVAEEREMADAFGQDFWQCAEQVPRYLPWVTDAVR